MTAKGHRFSIQQGKRQSPTSFYHCSAPELHPFHGETKPNWRNILFLNTPYSKSGLNVKVLKVLRFQVTTFPFPVSKEPWENTEFYCNFHISIHDPKKQNRERKRISFFLSQTGPYSWHSLFLPTAVYFLSAFLSVLEKENCRRVL